MTSSFPRFLAGLILVAGGALTGLTAFGIVVARWAIDLKDIAITRRPTRRCSTTWSP